MKKINYLFLLLALPFLLTACAEVCLPPMEFTVFGRGGEDDMVLPERIKGVKTNLTMAKVYAAPAQLHVLSRYAQRLDETVRKNCQKMQAMSSEDRKKFEKDTADYDKLLDSLTIVLRSTPGEYKDRAEAWLEDARKVMDK